MATSINAVLAHLASSLASGGSESTFFLDKITSMTGETMLTTDFSVFGKGIITIDPLNSNNIEFCSFTAVDGSAISLTGGVRGLSAKDYTASSSRAKYHPVGTTVIIAFGSHNLLDLKTYMDNLIIGSVGSASSTVSGTTKLSENPTVPTSPIAVGVNSSMSGTAISASNKAVDVASISATSSANKVVQAGAGGKIDNTFLNNLINTQTFITPGANTWTKPTGAKVVEVILIGGGGTGTPGYGNNEGGAGGSGGGYIRKAFDASLLSTTETVTVGASDQATTFGTWLKAGAGANGGSTHGDSGAGGQGIANGSAGMSGASGSVVGKDAVTGGASGASCGYSGGGVGGTSGGCGYQAGAAGGGSGGGGPSNGGSGGRQYAKTTPINGGSAGTVGAGQAGGKPNDVTTGEPTPGAGGGGGAGVFSSGTPGAGGAGGLYGGGGGGGGSASSTGGAAGGSGAQGIAQVITYL